MTKQPEPNRPELGSVSIGELCPHIRGSLFTVCLGEKQLRSIGMWDNAGHPCDISQEIWCRIMLGKACAVDVTWEERVNDWFDLHYLDTVILVRTMSSRECKRTVELWVESPDGKALPALSWALCSDKRGDVYGQGIRLIQEAVSVSRRILVESNEAQETRHDFS